MLHPSEKRVLQKFDHTFQNKLEHTENYQLGYLRALVLRLDQENTKLQAQLDKEPTVDIEGLGFDKDDLLISTCRYYTGMCTAQAGSFAEHLAKMWHQLSRYAQNIIRRDLEHTFDRDDRARALRKDAGNTDQAGLPLGWDMDRECWELVRQAWLQPTPEQFSLSPYKTGGTFIVAGTPSAGDPNSPLAQ